MPFIHWKYLMSCLSKKGTLTALGIEIALSARSSSKRFLDASSLKHFSFLVRLFVAWEVPDETFEGCCEEGTNSVFMQEQSREKNEIEKGNGRVFLILEKREVREFWSFESERGFRKWKRNWIDFSLNKKERLNVEIVWEKSWIQNLNLMKVLKKKRERNLKRFWI